MGRWWVLVGIALGSACAERDRAEDAPRLEFLDFHRECFDSCGVTSVEHALRIEVAAGARPLHGPVQWMRDADSDDVLASADVALAPGEQTTLTLAYDFDGSCSTSEGETREVTVWIDLDGELLELSGEGYYGAGWGEC